MCRRSKEESMGIGDWLCSDLARTGRLCKTLAVTSLVLMLLAGTSRAGDVSGQPTNSLSSTNSATNVLPQVEGAQVAHRLPAERQWPAAAYPDPRGSNDG